MMRASIEALYILDQFNEPILEHVYRSRPPSARLLLPHYLAHTIPRPSLIYLPDLTPVTLLFSINHNDLLFLSPVSAETEPLFVLEFLHRVVEVLEEFLGGPLLSNKIQGAYDVVAQLLNEMCDAGAVCNTEPNALKDDVDVAGFLGKLLGGVGLPGSSPALTPAGGLKQQLSLNPINNGPAIPWRRANVRHTSNEMYVDIVESLSVTLAPSGRPLAAFANGSIAFTSKISGVPDLLLTLSASGGKLGMEKAIELPVFHPCVRLARWKERPGELSFVPPDGKFMLAGYEVNLMPSTLDLKTWSSVDLRLPVSIEVSKSLGPNGADFEIRLLFSATFPGASVPAPSTRPGLGSRGGSGRSTPIFGSGSSAGPTLQDVVVTVPIPANVRNISDIQASRGEAYFAPVQSLVEWRVPTKDASTPGSATLRCTVVGPLLERNDDEPNGMSYDMSNEYDENENTYQSSGIDLPKAKSTKEQEEYRDERKVQENAPRMPSSASVSFKIKGWLASGIKVEGLVIDTRKSRGLGEGVKPYKGVKYMTEPLFPRPQLAIPSIILKTTSRAKRNHQNFICRFRVRKVKESDGANDDPQEEAILPLGECNDLETDIRVQWANEVIGHFEETKESHTSIRSWDFIAGLDGSVKTLPMPRPPGDLISNYPVRFQIPTSSLDRLDQEERVKRSERFAMANLLYQIMTGKVPWEDLTDEEVRHRFSRGEFPDDTANLPNMLFILSGWSKEFSQELTTRMERQNVSYIQSLKDYARAHPIRTGIQVVGVGVSVVSLCAPLTLGALGFTAAGPAAGTAAAGWQASIGVVKAGSLFSWCQSAAMGGQALGVIHAAGAAGAAGAALTRVGDVPKLMETFKKGG